MLLKIVTLNDLYSCPLCLWGKTTPDDLPFVLFFFSINLCKSAYVLWIIVIVAGINMVPLTNLVFPNIIITRQKL